jgi:putative ABC transport system substrate-binding protein
VIDRRNFGNALAMALLGASLPARSQPIQTLPVVGVLSSAIRGKAYRTLIEGLREAGYVEGRTVSFESRFADGNPAAFAGLASQLVKSKVDVIFAVGPAAVKAVRDTTRAIPIVALDLETDPIQAGWARSLARPGGNLTGLFLDVPALAGKWIELLRAATPDLRRLGLLWDSNTGPSQLIAAKAAARALGIDILVMELRRSDDIDAALRAGNGAGIGGMVILSSPMLDGAANAKLIADFAVNTRLPAISPFRSFSDPGGLMSYGPNLEDFFPHAAGFVARILKGERPANMAIALPTKYELIINLKTAKALGLTMPRLLLLRADVVIQ